MLKCDLNNTPFLISLLELKWFHRSLALEALCSPRATCELGQVAGSREPGALQWQLGRRRVFDSDAGPLG